MKHKFRKYLAVRMKTGGIGQGREPVRYIRYLFLACFLVGIISANLLGVQRLGGFGIWNSYFIEKFKYTDIRSQDLFFYVLGERLPVFLLLLTLSVTNWGVAASNVFISWQAFAGGFMMAASVVTYSVKGILLVAVALLPQYLIYVPVYMGYFYLTIFFRKRMGGAKERGESFRTKEYLIFFALCLILLLAYVTGIFLESYTNPLLLKRILKIF